MLHALRVGPLSLLALAGAGALALTGSTPDAAAAQERAVGPSAVTLSAGQLRINQRISQAAVRRANALEGWLEAGRPAGAITLRSAPAGRGGAVRLSAAQLRINQRISQAAIRRASTLQARLHGRRPPAPPREGGSGSGRLSLSAAQLLINQRIAQAAVRRTNALLRAAGGDVGAGALRLPAPAAAPAAPPAPLPSAPPAPPPTVFVSPGGSDAGPCDTAQPCASLDRAVRVASPGETIELAGGDYPRQEIAATGRPPGPVSVIQPAPDASVHLAYLRVHTTDLEFRGLRSNGWYVDDGAHRTTLRDHVSSGAAFITNSDDVRILGGEIAGVDSADGLQVKGDSSGPRRLLIDGISIRDITRRSDPSSHVECIQFTSGREVVIRNSRFDACGTQGVFFRGALGGVIDGVLVENNWFGTLDGFYTLIFSQDVANMTARYNSFAQSPRFGGHPENQSGIEAYGNVGQMEQCGAGVSYSHNVWSEARCGAGDLRANPGFVDRDGFDLRLRPGSAAINRGDPQRLPAIDRFGTARPQGGAPDAGAHEAG